MCVMSGAGVKSKLLVRCRATGRCLVFNVLHRQFTVCTKLCVVFGRIYSVRDVGCEMPHVWKVFGVLHLVKVGVLKVGVLHLVKREGLRSPECCCEREYFGTFGT